MNKIFAWVVVASLCGCLVDEPPDPHPINTCPPRASFSCECPDGSDSTSTCPATGDGYDPCACGDAGAED